MVITMIKVLKKCVIFAVVAVAVVMTMGSSSVLGADSKDDSELFIIRYPRPFVFESNIVAEALGFFKEEGLKIEYVTTVEGLSSFQMLAQGLIDVAGPHPNSVAQARLAGIKVLAVVPDMVDNPKYPHVRYIAREDGPIKSLEDIVDKKVAIRAYAACYEGYLQTYLDDKGVKGDVAWVVLPAGGQAEQALSQGLVDLTTSHPPFATLAFKAGGNKEIATSWDIFKKPAAGLAVYVFHEDFLAKHPDKARAFAKAMYKTRKWINRHVDESIYLVAKELKLDPESVNVELDGRWYTETPSILKEDIELWFDISEKLGYWKHGDIRPEDIFTNEFDPTEEPVFTD
jgi:ABC-type nitrate/sulfonate/bicarbonate transport system substrate-binding protein